MLHEIPDRLQTEIFGQELHIFDEIDSTNRWLRDHIDQLPHGTVAVADYQSAGRGRLKRSWSAPPGTGLLISILLKPNWSVERAGWLMMISGLAAIGASTKVAEVNAGLKWPNDIVWHPAGGSILHKLGGILSESIFDKGRLSGGILGIGLNVNMTAEQLPPAASPAVRPASLRTLTGKKQSRAALAAELLLSLETDYKRCNQNRSPLSGWKERLVTLGEPVAVTEMANEGGKAWHGIAVDVDEWGRLVVEDNSGKRQAVTAGDVTLRIEDREV